MYEGEPFKESLQDSEYSHKIKLLESRPDKIVRKHHGVFLKNFIEQKENIKKELETMLLKISDEDTQKKLKENAEEKVKKIYQEELEKGIDTFKRGKAMFQKLEKEYGIAVPKMDFVLGEEKEYPIPIMYAIVDKIEGENLENILQLPLEAKEKVDDFYLNLLRYYADLYQNGGDWWSDFKNKQIVYGHKKDEAENRLYIVDIEPYFVTLTKEEIKKGSYNELLEKLIHIFFSIKRVEGKFSPPQKLTRAREKISDAIMTFQEDICRSSLDRANFQYLKEKLRE